MTRARPGFSVAQRRLRGGRRRYSFGSAFVSDVSRLRRRNARTSDGAGVIRPLGGGARHAGCVGPRRHGGALRLARPPAARLGPHARLRSAGGRSAPGDRVGSRAGVRELGAVSSPTTRRPRHMSRQCSTNTRRSTRGSGSSDARTTAASRRPRTRLSNWRAATLVALLDHDDLLRPHSLLLSVLPFLERLARRLRLLGRGPRRRRRAPDQPLLQARLEPDPPALPELPLPPVGDPDRSGACRRRLSEAVRRQSGLGSRAEGHRAHPTRRGRSRARTSSTTGGRSRGPWPRRGSRRSRTPPTRRDERSRSTSHASAGRGTSSPSVTTRRSGSSSASPLAKREHRRAVDGAARSSRAVSRRPAPPNDVRAARGRRNGRRGRVRGRGEA